MAILPVQQQQTNLGDQVKRSQDATAQQRDNAPKQESKKQNDKITLKKLDVKNDIWSLFTGLYSLLTYPGIISNQIENYVTMSLKALNNAMSVDDPSLKEGSELKEYVKSASARPSIFKSILAIPAKILGYNKENGKDFDGFLTFYARLLQTVFKPFFSILGLTLPFNLPSDGDPSAAKTDFNFIKHKDMSPGTDGEPNDPKGHIRQWIEQVNPDPSVNANRQGLLGFWYNLNHPTTSRNALSFIFNVKNDIEVLKNKLPPNIGVIGHALNALKIVSSTVASVFAPAGSFLAWLFALTGKKLLITASSLWALIGAIHVPSNHALELLINLFSAHGTSRKTGKPLKECLQDLGMLNFGKLFHAIAGGFAAIPSTLGFFARMFQVYKDTRYVFVPSGREFAKIIFQILSKLGLTQNASEKDFEETGANLVKGTAKVLRDALVPVLENIINLAPLRVFLRMIFPVAQTVQGREKIPLDVYRNILTDIIKTDDKEHRAEDDRLKGTENEKYRNFMGTPTVDPYAKDVKKEQDKRNLIFGFIPKSESMMYLFKVFGAFANWSVSVAYAFESLFDKDIQQHAVAPVRYFDKVIGLINAALSMPNALIYGVTARLPQMLAGYYDIKQRIADKNNWKGKDAKAYDVMQEDVIPFTNRLLKSSNPFFRYVGKSLNEDIVFNVYGKDVFKDPVKANDLITNFYEKLSFKQEYSIEAPAALEYVRNFIKWSMNNMPALLRANPALAN